MCRRVSACVGVCLCVRGVRSGNKREKTQPALKIKKMTVMDTDAAMDVIRGMVRKWAERRNCTVDATGKPLPDGIKTKLIPSGEPGIALEVTLEKEEFLSTRVEKPRHELRICRLDTSILRDRAGASPEQMIALIALCSTFDVVIMAKTPEGEGLHAASCFKNLLSHHSSDYWELVLLSGCAAFFRSPISILKSIDMVVFHDPRFKSQDRVKTLKIKNDCVVLTDGEDEEDEEDEENEENEEQGAGQGAKGGIVHDGWFRSPAGREVETQRVRLELQVQEVGDVKKDRAVESETGAREEEGEDDDDDISLLCLKIFD